MNSWPKYFADRLILGNPASDSAIATLWTPMNVVASMADVSKIAIVGQLYTKRGINYLLRNVLLNPRIRRILLIGADLMGSGEALLKIAEKGLSFRRKDSPLEEITEADWLDEQIDEKATRLFAQHVDVINKIGPVSPDEVRKFVAKSKETSVWADPQEFPDPEATGGGALPSEETIYAVRGEKMWQAWLRMLQLIMRFGRPSPMIHHYGKERITELINVAAVVTDENPDKLDLPSWLPYKEDDIKRYIKGFLSSSRGDEAYTYGERLKAFPLDLYDKSTYSNLLKDWSSSAGGDFRAVLAKTISGTSINQQQLLAEKLKSFSENKGAIAVLWEPIIDNFGLREVWRTPCLVLVQAMIRDDRLFLTAYFRSNDMMGGWPLNVFGLRAFQKELVTMIDKKLKLGPLTTISHSAHVYESSWQQAEKLVHDHWNDVSCQWDPRGNLNVEVDGKFIVVKHLSPDGIFLDEYRQDGTKEKASRDLCFQLESAGLFTVMGSAMYAARQIERAETAIKLGVPFVSDQALDFSRFKTPNNSKFPNIPNSSAMEPYKRLVTYIFSVIIYDLTVEFCRRFLSRTSRTVDQMEQAARSTKQNIAEGATMQSTESYIKLLGVSEGSVKELANDYEDFLRQRKLAIWAKDDVKIGKFRAFRAVWKIPNIPNTPTLPIDPEEAANMILTFCQMESFLLHRQIESLTEKFVQEGGFRENLFKKRLDYRRTHGNT